MTGLNQFGEAETAVCHFRIRIDFIIYLKFR